jgi:uncharacterized protein (TIGR03435 family)
LRPISLVVILALAAELAHAQTAAAAPAFDAASIKLSKPDTQRTAGGGPGTADPGQYHSNAVSLLQLLTVAYSVPSFQISSRTPLDRDTYDVAAKVPAGATRDQFREMLRNLLAERLHLKVHQESREFPVLELTVAKTGPKLKESALDASAGRAGALAKLSADGFPQLPPGKSGIESRYAWTDDGFAIVRISAQGETMARLNGTLRATRIAFPGPDSGMPIVDHTGLPGRYDFRLEYSQESRAGAPGEARIAPAPDLFKALTQQLGLQLAPKKVPFDVWVVDSFDRTPVGN